MLKITEQTNQTTLCIESELFPVSGVAKTFGLDLKQSFLIQIRQALIANLLPVTFKNLQPVW